MGRISPPRPTDTIDGVIGFVGFFAIVLLVATVACEVTGRPALTWALLLLALVIGLLAAVTHRRSLVRRTTK